MCSLLSLPLLGHVLEVRTSNSKDHPEYRDLAIECRGHDLYSPMYGSASLLYDPALHRMVHVFMKKMWLQLGVTVGFVKQLFCLLDQMVRQSEVGPLGHDPQWYNEERGDGHPAVPCDEDELALLPPLPKWALRTLLYFPFPVPDGDDTVELGCIA